MMIAGEPQEMGLEQRTTLEVESVARLIEETPHGKTAFLGGYSAEICGLENNRSDWIYYLDRCSIGADEASAESLVPLHNFHECTLERIFVQGAPHACGSRYRIGGT